jgi:hypothetical protein
MIQLNLVNNSGRFLIRYSLSFTPRQHENPKGIFMIFRRPFFETARKI